MDLADVAFGREHLDTGRGAPRIPRPPAARQDRDTSRRGYNLKEAARVLGVCENTLRRQIARGNVKATRLGRCIIIGESELRRILGEESSR